MDALDSFRCCKDDDIEQFLWVRACQFLERGWCSVYLILDEEAFNRGKLKIDAYFTLSHKALISETVSKNKVKDTAGFKGAGSVHFVLIGQLGKYIEQLEDGHISSSEITSEEILNDAFEVIRASSNLIPCRCVLVECSENKKVQKVYTDYGFSPFQYDGGHYQFYKRI